MRGTGGLCIVFLITIGLVVADRERRSPISGKHLKVTTILDEPFLSLKDDPDGKLTGNDRFEGYIKSLMDNLAREMQFSYSMQLVADGKYGSPQDSTDSNTPWNGMVGELIDKKVDVAAAPLTVTYIRERFIDFTKPFMSLGITIIMNKKDVTSVVQDDSSAIFFLRPFTYSVWLCLAVAFAAITVLLYLICRFDPYEKGSKHCEGKKCEGSRFDFLGSLWFVCGGLTLQGYTNRPRSAAGLVLSAIWWSFSIIILATYIMGLVSTQARAMFAVPGLKIRNLGDLLAQNETSFGCIQSGSTFTFFKQSNVAAYQKAYQRMKAFSDSSLVKSTKDGLDKVENGGYAYIGESTIIDYLVRRRCDTVKVGGVLDRKSYALACAEGSPYTAELSKGLLILREKGILRMLQAKWWDSDAECKDGYEVTSSMFLPSESAKFSPKTVIDLTIFGGIFFYLIIGVVLAVVTLLIEIFVHRRRKNREPKEKALEADKEEKDGSQKMQEIA